MAGHSHWAGIKHKKALIDSKRGKLWSRLSKAIIIAAKIGGGDPDSNSRLRQAIADAKAVSMPKDNISRAVKKGTGEIAGGDVEEILYEGYGPNGVAVLCEVMTDNRNRTAPELRKLFEVHNGKLEKSNSVGYMFDRKGVFLIAKESNDEESLMEVALEAGAEDIQPVGENFEIISPPEKFSAVADALSNASIECVSRSINRIPKNTVDLDGDGTRKVLKFMDALDDHDDVQNVSANFNITPEIMKELDL